MSSVRKRYVVAVILALAAFSLVFWLRSHVFDRLRDNIAGRLDSLKISGFNLRYDSLGIDWLGSTIEIQNVVLEKNAYDTTCVYPEYISVKKVRAEGIAVIPLIFRSLLSLETLHLDTVRLVLRENSLLKLDSANQRKNEFTLKVDRVFVRSTDIMYTDSSRCKTIAALKSNLLLTGVDMDFHIDKPFLYAAETITMESMELDLPDEFYSFKVREARWNPGRQAFRADSIRVIPTLGKAEFGRTLGFETDRFDGVIPSLAASGIKVSNSDSLNIGIGLSEIRFSLKVFRDKRLRFIPKEKLLPVAMLRQLPFSIRLDSLKVIDSFVQYEEFAEGTSEPGGIYFDQLNADLNNISNTDQSGSATLNARARLFGEGRITLQATFPYEDNQRSSINGSIKNFSLPKLNAILTPSTQLHVESGEMKELLFDFTFNAVRSDGKLELNYEDLKVITFKDEEKTNGDGPEKDNLKSFILNTFVFRKNMTDDMPAEKRTGTISYVRDNSRSIFNLWSKSLISGIKSAYNLDKVEEKRSTRELKKEERASRREARRQKRAEKRDRERG